MCKIEEKLARREFENLGIDYARLETIIENAECDLEDAQRVLVEESGNNQISRNKIKVANKRIVFFQAVIEGANEMLEQLEKGEFLEEMTCEDF